MPLTINRFASYKKDIDVSTIEVIVTRKGTEEIYQANCTCENKYRTYFSTLLHLMYVHTTGIRCSYLNPWTYTVSLYLSLDVYSNQYTHTRLSTFSSKGRSRGPFRVTLFLLRLPFRFSYYLLKHG